MRVGVAEKGVGWRVNINKAWRRHCRLRASSPCRLAGLAARKACGAHPRGGVRAGGKCRRFGGRAYGLLKTA